MTLNANLQGDWAVVLRAHDPASTDPGAWLRYGVGLLQADPLGRAEQTNAFLAFEMARSLGAGSEAVERAVTTSALLSLAEASELAGLEQPAEALRSQAAQLMLALVAPPPGSGPSPGGEGL